MPTARPALRHTALVFCVLTGFGGLVVNCASGDTENEGPILGFEDGGDVVDGGSETSTGGSGGAHSFGGSGGSATGGSSGSTAGSGGASGAGGGFSTPGQQCSQCYDDEDCLPGLLCVVDPNGRKFCAGDCTTFSCDEAYDCVDLESYEKLGANGGSGQGGAPTDQDAGVDASPSDAGAASPHAGRKGCVPPNNESCPCNDKTEGLPRTCFRTNGQGTCTGSEICTNGTWKDCNAQVPSREVCDGVDNNCDGLTDEQDTNLTGNDLCSDTGEGPPHSSWVCEAGQCKLGSCEDGWSAFPDSLPDSAGCACHVDEIDVHGTNDVCSKATDLGEIKDDGKTTLHVTGTLSSASDEDWYAFHAVDVNQKPSFNTYRVHVEFTPDGNPNDEFRIDMYRSKTADKVCSTTKPGKNITSYDWCADSTSAPSKPADDDQSAYYRFRVFRKPGATPTCLRYKVVITNYGKGACPTADACGD